MCEKKYPDIWRLDEDGNVLNQDGKVIKSRETYYDLAAGAKELYPVSNWYSQAAAAELMVPQMVFEIEGLKVDVVDATEKLKKNYPITEHLCPKCGKDGAAWSFKHPEARYRPVPQHYDEVFYERLYDPPTYDIVWSCCGIEYHGLWSGYKEWRAKFISMMYDDYYSRPTIVYGESPVESMFKSLKKAGAEFIWDSNGNIQMQAPEKFTGMEHDFIAIDEAPGDDEAYVFAGSRNARGGVVAEGCYKLEDVFVDNKKLNFTISGRQQGKSHLLKALQGHPNMMADAIRRVYHPNCKSEVKTMCSNCENEEAACNCTVYQVFAKRDREAQHVKNMTERLDSLKCDKLGVITVKMNPERHDDVQVVIPKATVMKDLRRQVKESTAELKVLNEACKALDKLAAKVLAGLKK